MTATMTAPTATQPQLQPSLTTREGRMLAAGGLTVTVTSKATNQHVTLRMRASARNEGPGRNWPTVEFADATHVFIDDFDGARVATYYPKSNEYRFAHNASAAAKWTCRAVLRHCAGQTEKLAEQAEIAVADFCGHCGRQLTDPESIERGIGPDCYGKLTGSHHAAMWL